MKSFQDKVVVITGGARGVGFATAKLFVASGAKVILADVLDAAQQAEEIGGLYIKTDVSKEKQVKALMQAAIDRFGRLDVLVNNAAILRGGDYVADEPADTYIEQFNVNTMGTLFGIKYAAKHMQPGGSIVNVASLVGLMAAPGWSSYAASKAAIIAIGRCAALELGEKGIRVNTVCPHSINTSFDEQVGKGEEMATLVLAFSEMSTGPGRICEPEEVASVIYFYASDQASYLTGHAVPVDGGWTAGPTPATFAASIKFAQSDI